MALNLFYGTKPVALGHFRLGQRIRMSELKQMVTMQHEMWANAGENFGGIIYDRPVLSTTSTSFGGGSGNMPISMFQPFMQITVRHLNSDTTIIHWRCFCKNVEVRVQFLNSSYTSVGTSTVATPNGDDQWIGADAVISGLNSDNILGFRVNFRRLTFDTVGTVRHFAAIARPTTAGQIPT